MPVCTKMGMHFSKSADMGQPPQYILSVGCSIRGIIPRVPSHKIAEVTLCSAQLATVIAERILRIGIRVRSEHEFNLALSPIKLQNEGDNFMLPDKKKPDLVE